MRSSPGRSSGSSPGSDPYALTDADFPAPPLPGEAVVAKNADRVIDLLADDLLAQAQACVRRFGDFHLALSGGRTPEPLYTRLMYDPCYRMLPWRRTHLWIVDERRVTFDDERSNFGMIRETIVSHADIPEEQVHPIRALEPNADVLYEKELRANLEWREPGQDRLDFILLGMGADGHTASLFPRSEALRETRRLVRINEGGTTPAGGRVTMTYPLINAARFIAILVTGASKAEAIGAVVRGEDPVAELPIRGVEPLGGEMKWYLDPEAAGLDAPE